MAKYRKLVGPTKTVFFEGEDSHWVKHFRTTYPSEFNRRHLKDVGNELPLGLQVHKVYVTSDLWYIISEAQKAAKATAENEIKKELEAKLKRKGNVPLQGDPVQLLSEDGRPVEDFTYVAELITTISNKDYLIRDMYGVKMHVQHIPERDHPPHKAYRVVEQATED